MQTDPPVPACEGCAPVKLMHLCRQRRPDLQLLSSCHRANAIGGAGNTINVKVLLAEALDSCLPPGPNKYGMRSCRHVGQGTVIYPNQDKYEGEWLKGKRHGTGALWLFDEGRYKLQYTGEWQKDKFHVSKCQALSPTLP